MGDGEMMLKGVRTTMYPLCDPTKDCCHFHIVALGIKFQSAEDPRVVYLPPGIKLYVSQLLSSHLISPSPILHFNIYSTWL
jgi:hypothetical protein